MNDYVAGKKDWGSYGLPHEGTNVPDRLAGDVAHGDVPICPLADRLTVAACAAAQEASPSRHEMPSVAPSPAARDATPAVLAAHL